MKTGLQPVPETDARLKQEKPYYRESPKEDPPLTYIAELGFDNMFCCVGAPPQEQVFFVDTMDNTSFNATDEAIADYIKRQQHAIETVVLYLLNGKNNNTHEWRR
jgi:hypothetical protein